MSLIRIDKYLSDVLLSSRSDSKKLLAKGGVEVNGVTVKNGDRKINTEKDVITVEGKETAYRKYSYFLINKPKGILSASSDKSRKTVVDLLPAEYRRLSLSPVGRLDKDTTGLLILTDDGEYLHRVISPKSGIAKTYIAELDSTPDDTAKEIFLNGVTLADGSRCRPAALEILGDKKARITVTEGKYHEIKRMFGTLGIGVNELHRESIGNLKLPESLEPGEYKIMEIGEIDAVFS